MFSILNGSNMFSFFGDCYDFEFKFVYFHSPPLAMPLRQPWAISWERVETPKKKKPKHLAMDWAQHYPMYTWQEPKLQFNAICSVGKSWPMQHMQYMQQRLHRIQTICTTKW